MIMRNEKLAEFLKPGKRVHMVGIGGVSMRPLALVLKDRGITVTGSDMNSSGSTEELKPDYEIEYLADLSALLEEIE